MGSQGSPHARLRRALASGNAPAALAAAAELPHVELGDALALCLVLRDRDPARYPRAAARFAARYALELPRVELGETQLVVALLGALGGGQDAAAARGLAELFGARGRRDLVEALRRRRVERGA